MGNVNIFAKMGNVYGYEVVDEDILKDVSRSFESPVWYLGRAFVVSNVPIANDIDFDQRDDVRLELVERKTSRYVGIIQREWYTNPENGRSEILSVDTLGNGGRWF